MSRHEPDLVAVRELPPGRPEPTDESVARTWHTVTRGLHPAGGAVARPPRRVRWLAPVAAAATVVALAVGGAVLLTPDRPIPGPAAPGPDEVMARLIERAGRVPAVPVPAGRLLYLRAEGPQGWHETREAWYDPETLLPLRRRVDGVDQPIDAPPRRPGDTAEENARAVAAGGDWRYPTPGWLAGLPTDPAALRERLDREIEARPASPDERPPPENLTGHLLGLLARAEPRLSAPLRVALYQVIADLDGLEVREVTVAGHRYQAVGQREPSSRILLALLFDPVSGRVVGEYHDVRVDADGRPLPSGPAPVGAAVSGSHLIWTFAAVTGVDRTG
ncbi:hypothetical protein O7606_11765 [Micromonospora sp. WMMD882]|uniref:hypothetical protein n=1 Tax=Micromonospora sp. WMMD882 TaxID=3015151 RepID=UPI00248BF405|nr:hypothetical protein [Micromonospora sp. WMMD882]WBB81976.1 hypothetical protein O7606_11765 [Micromonospora sp. WMMD882]